ncbi:MAG TPA: type II toxin-antitoxin system PemK/MazF family toxin [Desulfatiglandales bacterium]|nr:type II toxin-antitoxin system PemK/MazF family toxin [Desulfatiglandales bacterium]
MNLKRGDVYWVDLDPTRGSEIQKMRPCVLVGATPISQARRRVVVVPLSTAGKPRPPIAVPAFCLGKQVVAVCDQIRAVDKARLIKDAGSLSKEDMTALDAGLRQVLSL